MDANSVPLLFGSVRLQLYVKFFYSQIDTYYYNREES